ncbi:MAG: hypothetical protein ACREDS_05035 [Limisphaerales bacterium]
MFRKFQRATAAPFLQSNWCSQLEPSESFFLFVILQQCGQTTARQSNDETDFPPCRKRINQRALKLQRKPFVAHFLPYQINSVLLAEF